MRVLITGPLKGVTRPSCVRAKEAKYSNHSGMRESWARISLIGRPVCWVSRSTNSGRRWRRRVAALERTVKRVVASALLHVSLWKVLTVEARIEVIVERGVESIVVICCSVDGFMIGMRCWVGGW